MKETADLVAEVAHAAASSVRRQRSLGFSAIEPQARGPRPRGENHPPESSVFVDLPGSLRFLDEPKLKIFRFSRSGRGMP